MAINIKDPEADRLARELAEATGESITTAVKVAMQQRLEAVRGAFPPGQARVDAIMRIAERAAKLPVYDERTAEEILGYDESGLPT